jgi:CO/xanthine dehydrogenase Mo-binding subunit
MVVRIATKHKAVYDAVGIRLQELPLTAEGGLSILA